MDSDEHKEQEVIARLEGRDPATRVKVFIGGVGWVYGYTIGTDDYNSLVRIRLDNGRLLTAYTDHVKQVCA